MLEKKGPLDASSVTVLAMLAATEVAKSDSPKELRAHYASYFQTLTPAKDSLSFEALSQATLTTAQTRLADPALAMVHTRNLGDFHGAANAALKAAWVLTRPDAVNDLGNDPIATTARAALAIPDDQRAGASELLAGVKNLRLRDPVKLADGRIKFAAAGLELTLTRDADQWKLTGVSRSTEPSPNAGVKVVYGDGFFSRYEPPMLSNIYDSNGRRTERKISELTTLEHVGYRSVSGDPHDRREVMRANVVFEDGSTAALYQIATPLWGPGEGVSFVNGGNDFSTVQPIVERDIYS